MLSSSNHVSSTKSIGLYFDVINVQLKNVTINFSITCTEQRMSSAALVLVAAHC